MNQKLMPTGSSILIGRPNSMPVNWDVILHDVNYPIPTLYRLFCDTFLVGAEAVSLECEHPDGTRQAIGGLCYQPVNYNRDKDIVMFYRFMDIESSVQAHLYGDSDWRDEGYLPVAECNHGGAVLVGMKDDEVDVIFVQTMAGKIVRLADNVFQFVRDIVMRTIPEDSLRNGVKFDQLYKNWNEDFWRVKDVQP